MHLVPEAGHVHPVANVDILWRLRLAIEVTDRLGVVEGPQAALHVHPHEFGGEGLGLHQKEGGHRVVQRRRPAARVQQVREQVREQAAEAAVQLGDARDCVRAEEGLVCWVQRDHVDREARLADHRGGERVCVDVEFGQGARVSYEFQKQFHAIFISQKIHFFENLFLRKFIS